MNFTKILVISALLSHNVFCSEREDNKNLHLPLYVCQALEGNNTKLEKINQHDLESFIEETNKNIKHLEKELNDKKMKFSKRRDTQRKLSEEQTKLNDLINLMSKSCPQILDNINKKIAEKREHLNTIYESTSEETQQSCLKASLESSEEIAI